MVYFSDPMAIKKSIITASEIGEYIYCKRGWWLKDQGLLKTTPVMIQGTAEHSRLLHLVYQHKILSILVLLLLGSALLGFIVWLALTYLF